MFGKTIIFIQTDQNVYFKKIQCTEFNLEIFPIYLFFQLQLFLHRKRRLFYRVLKQSSTNYHQLKKVKYLTHVILKAHPNPN